MKRLTFLDSGKPAFRIRDCVYKNAVADKLAAYEDTGLMPEEITANKSIIGDLTREICRQESEIEKLRELLKLAVKDMATAASDFCEYCSVCKYCKKDNYTCEYRMNIKDCINASDFRWQYADEVEEILKETGYE